ncbi:MAG: type IV pilin N-terminal domain-containing protein [Thermoplasmata archaeon]|nr:MAG: type IV pilin N-terminal domain-containing protein [Thermoplasmata archaeon]
MGEKVKIKKIWNEDGVTEIYGDLLILGITMTLFTGIFLFVYTMPAPEKGVSAEFDSAFEFCSGGGTINVTHMSGETLLGEYTRILLTKNFDEEIRILNTQGSDLDNPFYGIEGDLNWDPQERWSYFYKDIVSSDDLQISVVDIKSGVNVMKSNLYGSGFNSPPIIMERGYNPVPVINGSEVVINSKVFDPNGHYDIDSVYFNASVLNHELGNVELTDGDGDGIFQGNAMITSGGGNYNLTIVAQDMEGKMEKRRLHIQVMDASRPIVEFITIEPNSVEAKKEFAIRAVVVDLEDDLNFSDITITPEQIFYDNLGTIETSLSLVDEIPNGGIFETTGSSPTNERFYNMTLKAYDYSGLVTTKIINLAVIEDAAFGNGSFNDTIWAYLGPESLDFKKFYYTIDDPPTNSSTYHLAVYIQEEHIGDDCFLHVNIINHYYEDVYIDGNSKIRLLQIGGAASNKDLGIVQNGSSFGDPVGTIPDGSWYRIHAPSDGNYFKGGDPVSLVFGPFDMSSANENDVFGSILVLTGSFGSESITPEDRYGQTIPFQAIVIA